MENKKISTLIGTVIILAVAVIAFAGILVLERKQIPEVVETKNTVSQNIDIKNSSVNVAGLITYTNNQYGFSLKYPETENSGVNDTEADISKPYSNIMVVIRPITDSKAGSFIMINIDNSKEILEKCFKRYPYVSSKASPDMKYKKQINGFDFYTNSEYETGQFQFNIIHNSNCYMISNGSNNPEDTDTANYIISTFKFTK